MGIGPILLIKVGKVIKIVVGVLRLFGFFDISRNLPLEQPSGVLGCHDATLHLIVTVRTTFQNLLYSLQSHFMLLNLSKFHQRNIFKYKKKGNMTLVMVPGNLQGSGYVICPYG